MVRLVSVPGQASPCPGQAVWSANIPDSGLITRIHTYCRAGPRVRQGCKSLNEIGGDRGSHTKPRHEKTPSEQRLWAADWSSPRCDENETSIKTARAGLARPSWPHCTPKQGQAALIVIMLSVHAQHFIPAKAGTQSRHRRTYHNNRRTDLRTVKVGPQTIISRTILKWVSLSLSCSVSSCLFLPPSHFRLCERGKHRSQSACQLASHQCQ